MLNSQSQLHLSHLSRTMSVKFFHQEISDFLQKLNVLVGNDAYLSGKLYILQIYLFQVENSIQDFFPVANNLNCLKLKMSETMFVLTVECSHRKPQAGSAWLGGREASRLMHPHPKAC